MKTPSYSSPAAAAKIPAKQLKPFVKWAGGKGKLLPELTKLLTAREKTVTKYCEPMVGGGALLFYVLSADFGFDEFFICDRNAELINAYLIIKTEVDALIARLSIMQADYHALGNSDRKNYYCAVRDEFNTTETNAATAVDKAAQFVFLNRTCFNGLYRVNGKGRFNVPIGAYANPKIYDEENLRKVSRALQRVTVTCGDYTLARSFIDENTFVYFDPPYRPLSKTSNFISYNSDTFDDGEQIRLAEFIGEIDDAGAQFVLSNSDPKSTNPADDFFDELYIDYTIKRVTAPRMINSNAEMRGEVSELLIYNKGENTMIKNGSGGGNTRTGLVFEGKTDLATFIGQQPHYTVFGHDVFFDSQKVGEVYKKHDFYKIFLKRLNINWEEHISKKLLPDDSIFVLNNNTLFIIECKHQEVEGSVDEKLQTCDFKKKQYKKLMAPANIEVEYIYLLDNWFKNPKYRDVRDYIQSVGCDYYFEYIPLTRLGLPVPPELVED